MKLPWTERDPITDDECILLCLKNCTQLCGVDKKQVARLIERYEPSKRKAVPAYKGISLFALRGALGPHYMKDWTDYEKEEARNRIELQD